MKTPSFLWSLFLLTVVASGPGCSSDGTENNGDGDRAAAGGATQTGGAGSGGSSSGGTSSGGAAGDGGTPSGGVPGVGGDSTTGGMPGSGGDSASGGATDTGGSSSGGGSASDLSFFVSSTGFDDGNLGGISAADALCQTLATAVGAGSKTWHAYLSAYQDPENSDMQTNAAERIGSGPWVNADGLEIAADLTDLHARSGNAEELIDENGSPIPGQWEGSPTPNEHDILTGSDPDGMAIGSDCSGWTSSSGNAMVGHSDGLGPNANPAPPYDSWNSSHTSSCGDLESTGGAGRVYCFAID